MNKYHVNQVTGRAGICRAQAGKCPLGSDTPHFNSRAEATNFIETTEAANNNTFKSMSKESANDKVYQIKLSELNGDHNGVLRGKNLKEALKNLNEDYENIKELPRMSKKDLVEDLVENMKDNAYVIDYSQGSTFNYDEYEKASKTGKEFFTLEVKGRHIILENEDYLRGDLTNPPYLDKSKYKLISDDVRYFGEDDYYMQTNYNLKKYNYTYEINDDLNEQLENGEKFEEFSRMKRIIENPNLPDWAIMAHKETPNVSGDFDDRMNLKNSKTEIEKVEKSIDEIKKKIDRMPASYKNAEKKDKILKDLKKDRAELEEALKNTNSGILKKALQRELNEVRFNEEKEKRLRDDNLKKSSSSFKREHEAKINELEAKKAQIIKNTEEIKKRLYEDTLKRSCPVNDGRKINSIVSEWMRKNPDAYKDFNFEIFN